MLLTYALPGLCFALKVNALTYYLDHSCNSKMPSSVFTEIKLMATEGLAGLKNPSDTIMAANFKTLFDFKNDAEKSTAVTKAESKSNVFFLPLLLNFVFKLYSNYNSRF